MSEALRKELRPPGFTQIDNAAIRNGKLTLKARAILGILLSFPDGKKINVDAIQECCERDGRDAIRGGIQELEAAGYVKRTKTHGESGHWINEFCVSDFPRYLDEKVQVTPQTDFPAPAEPASADPAPGKPAARDKDCSSTQVGSEDSLTRENDSGEEQEKASPDGDARRRPRKRNNAEPVPEDARTLAEHIAARCNEHLAALGEAREVKVSPSALDAARLLLGRGVDTADEKIPAPTLAKAVALVDYVFDHPERDASGFAWADQIESAAGLRKKWGKVAKWANGHRDAAKKAQQPRMAPWEQDLARRPKPPLFTGHNYDDDDGISPEELRRQFEERRRRGEERQARLRGDRTAGAA